MAFFPFMIQMQDKLCVIGGGVRPGGQDRAPDRCR